jgi:hypothetical protein
MQFSANLCSAYEIENPSTSNSYPGGKIMPISNAAARIGSQRLRVFEMESSVAEVEKHARTLRAWQLALLRFAVTLNNADRLAFMMIAAEIDRLGSKHGTPDFGFFRNTSAELCVAILQPGASPSAVLHQFVTQIDDERLARAFAAALEINQPNAASAVRPAKRDKSLWRGLSSRTEHALQEER